MSWRKTLRIRVGAVPPARQFFRQINLLLRTSLETLTFPHLVRYIKSAGWSSLVARWAHNPKVEGSNPSPATNSNQ